MRALASASALAWWIRPRRGVAFRHELARLVIEESIAPDRRVALHARALRAMADSADHARLAHHADAAGDADAVLRFAPEAARRASALGAHRESAAQYARALRFAETLAQEERAELLEHRAYECMLTDQSDDAIDALRSAITIRSDLGDVRAEADALQLLSNVLWCPGLRCRRRAGGAPGGGIAGARRARSRAGDGVQPRLAALHGRRGC